MCIGHGILLYYDWVYTYVSLTDPVDFNNETIASNIIVGQFLQGRKNLGQKN